MGKLRNVLSLVIALGLFASSSSVLAHSGRTDSSGGHNCSQKSISKGLCSGYHYHNGGNTSLSPSRSTTSSYSAPKQTQKPTYQTVTVLLNGVQQNYEQPAIIKNGRTLVPMRPVFEALGASVDFNQITNEITAIKEDRTITLTIGSQHADVNGSYIELETEVQNINGKTMVPLRFVSESMGATVEWDGQVNISY